jgi:hypothetical protein
MAKPHHRGEPIMLQLLKLMAKSTSLVVTTQKEISSMTCGF